MQTSEKLWINDLDEFTKLYKEIEAIELEDMHTEYSKVCKKAHIKPYSNTMKPVKLGEVAHPDSVPASKPSKANKRKPSENLSSSTPKSVSSKRQKVSENAEESKKSEEIISVPSESSSFSLSGKFASRSNSYL